MVIADLRVSVDENEAARTGMTVEPGEEYAVWPTVIEIDTARRGGVEELSEATRRVVEVLRSHGSRAVSEEVFRDRVPPFE